MGYYGTMKLFLRLAVPLALVTGAWAQSAPPPAAPANEVTSSPMDGPLFLQLLLAELNIRQGDPGAGYSLMLDAARRTGDEALYERAVEMALQSRAGDAALQAARAWHRAKPASLQGNRYVLQILIALNRIGEIREPLRDTLAAMPPAEQPGAIAMLPRLFARSQDRKLAAEVVEEALDAARRDPATAGPALTATGWMRLLADDIPGAQEAARQAQSLDPSAEGPALLALEMTRRGLPLAEPMVRRYLAGTPQPEIRMAWIRTLLEASRQAEARQQLERLTVEKPDLAEAWLLLGTLQLQDRQPDDAQTSIEKFLALGKPDETEGLRGATQAYLALAQIAELRQDYASAEAWLARIDSAADRINAQSRRASILARQGKLDDARAMLRAIPEREPGDARLKLLAEVQLLRDNGQPRLAVAVLDEAMTRFPDDHDLLYDQAMLAEKLGDLDRMEALLKRLIERKPDHHHAYNALGYSLADRNLRLPEAKALIEKALAMAPGDPYIQDSMAWVEFRLGNLPEARRLLEAAYRARPDAEIAAHLGEVLWVLGEKARATAIWKEGLVLNAGNETLQATLRRLGVQP